MKTIAKFRIFALFATFGIIFSSCQGPRGYDGRDGVDGVGLVSTTFIKVKSSDWSPISNSTNMWSAKINVPAITENIVNHGLVLVYVGSSSGTNSWLSLPYSQAYKDSKGVQYQLSYYYWHYPGGVELQFQDSHPTNPLDPGVDDDFKIVVVDNIARLNLKNVDLNDYNKVSKALNLRDSPYSTK